MLRRASFLLVGPLLAGCACRPCRPCPPPDGATWTGAPPPVALPPAPAAAPPRPAPPAPPTPAERLARAASAPDPAGALIALAREAPDVLRDAPSDAFAPLLSGRVRLVDLRDVGRDGGDAPPHAPGPIDRGTEEPGDGVDPRVRRIAQGVRDALGTDAWEAGGTLLAVRPWGLVVVQAPDRWIDVEKALDRFAVAGGPAARIAVLVSDDADAFAKAVGLEGGGWTRTDAGYVPDLPGVEGGPVPSPAAWATPALDDAAWARAEAAAAVPVLRVPVSGDRRVAAGRTSRSAYVQDFDVEIPPRSVSAVVGSLVSGTAARAWRDGDGWRAEVVRGEVVRPIPTFETSVSGFPDAPKVRIELPEVRLSRIGARLEPRAGSAVLLRAGGGTAGLFRVESHEVGTTTRPAWRWWKPEPEATHPYGSRGERGWPLTLGIERRAGDGSARGPVDAPSLLLTEGEERLVTVGEEESYVAGVTVTPGAATRVVDPTVGVIATGLLVRARVVPRSDGSAVVEGRLRLEDLERPLRTVTAVLGSGSPVSFQLPRTWRNDVPFRVPMRPGESVEFPAAARTAHGPETLRVRLTLGEPVRLFTPWPRERP